MKAIDYVLLWGYTEDDTIISIRNALSRLGQPVFFINQEYDLTNMQVDVFVDHDVEGVIRLDQNHQIALKSIKAAYLRPGDWRNVSTVGNETVEDDVDNNNANNDSYDIRAQIEYAEDRLWCWSDLTPALVINRVSAMASNGSKPYQSSQIHSVGFEIPDTLITTDPTAVLEFWKYYGKVIYKSISGVRSIVSQLTAEHLERLDNVKWCPTQFQQYIPGNDYRVHVVGDDDVFSSQIVSKADDYRYAARKGFEIQIIPCQIPTEVRDRCVMLARLLGLVVAGIDLRCTDDGKWYCFEVNPSPGFSYYQKLTGQPIDEAIARLLINANV